jgi:hypothetical protein
MAIGGLGFGTYRAVDLLAGRDSGTTAVSRGLRNSVAEEPRSGVTSRATGPTKERGSPMPNLYRAAVLAALLLLTGCSVVNGSGQTKSETRTVSGFTGIELSGTGEVTIEQGDAESLTVEADDNVLPALTSEWTARCSGWVRSPGPGCRRAIPSAIA